MYVSTAGPMHLDALTETLCAHCKEKGLMVWPEMPLGSVTRDPGTQRADVLTMAKTYNPSVHIYEIKRSRSDFQRDVNKGKYLGYLPYCTQLSFATPVGLLNRDEIPGEAGLITWKEDRGWHVSKAAPRHALDQERFNGILFPLLFRGHSEAVRVRRLSERVTLDENLGLAAQVKHLGFRVAQRIAAPDEAWTEVQAAKAEIEKIIGPHDNYSALRYAAMAWATSAGAMGRMEDLVHFIRIAHDWFHVGDEWVIERLANMVEKLKTRDGGEEG